MYVAVCAPVCDAVVSMLPLTANNEKNCLWMRSHHKQNLHCIKARADQP